jgi:hypothetical protein
MDLISFLLEVDGGRQTFEAKAATLEALHEFEPTSRLAQEAHNMGFVSMFEMQPDSTTGSRLPVIVEVGTITAKGKKYLADSEQGPR